MTFRGVNNRRIQPYTRRITSVGGKGLSFDLGSFTNTSTRYMMIKNPNTGLWEMAGPFGSGVLASRVIGGKRYGQFEASRSNVVTYSEAYRTAIAPDWTDEQTNITDNAMVSPVGELTADLVYENTDTNSHAILNSASFVDTNRYFIIAFGYPAGRPKVQLWASGTAFPGTVRCNYDLSTGATDSPVTCDYYGALPMSNGMYCVYMSDVADATIAASVRLKLLDSLWADSYAGDGSSGACIWGYSILRSPFLSSYIKTVAAAATRTKDQFYWSEAVIDAKAPWVRNGFRGSVILSHATDELLAADGGEHLIAAYNTTGAKGVVELYFDGADKKIKWRDDDTGALGESVAINNNLGDKIDFAWTLDNGPISTLWVDGGGISSATYNGSAATAAADGALYYGMNDSEALQLDIGHLSEPEPLTGA